MEAGSKERLVGVDVAETPQELLIQQQGLESHAALGQPLCEFVRFDLKWLRSQCFQSLGHCRGPLPLAELARVMEYQPAAARQEHLGARMDPGFDIQQEIARHPQVDYQDGTASCFRKAKDQVLAVTVDSFDQLTRKLGSGPVRVTHARARPMEHDGVNVETLDARCQGSSDGFDFW